MECHKQKKLAILQHCSKYYNKTEPHLQQCIYILDKLLNEPEIYSDIEMKYLLNPDAIWSYRVICEYCLKTYPEKAKHIFETHKDTIKAFLQINGGGQ